MNAPGHMGLAALKKLLDYDPDTGVITRRVTTNARSVAGQPAGGLDTHGYVVFYLQGERLRAHRVAWLFTHGVEAASKVYHLDGDRANNRAANLSPGYATINPRNPGQTTNASGVKGVTWSVSSKQWLASLTVRGKTYNLGLFRTVEAAGRARKAAEVIHRVGPVNYSPKLTTERKS